MNKNIKNSLAVIGLSLIVTSTVPMAFAMATPKVNDNVTFCHATNSFKNPYVSITTDPDSIFKNGHDGHNDPVYDGVIKPWGDIIPSFDYDDNGTLKTYPGLNLGNGGAAILANGCDWVTVQPSVTPSVTVSPTATVTPSASVSPSPSVTPSATALPSVTVIPTVTVSPTGDIDATATAIATASVTPSVDPTETVVPTVSPSHTAIPPVLPTRTPVDPPRVNTLPYTGDNTANIMKWGLLGIGSGTVLLAFGLYKKA